MRSVRSIAVRIRRLPIAALYAFCMLAAAPVPCAGQPLSLPLNGFYVRSLPPDYAAKERFFAGLKGSGANLLIIELPVTSSGNPASDQLTAAVYLSHQAGLAIAVVL